MLSNAIKSQQPRNVDKKGRNGVDWREGPSFLDSTSSVAVSTFGARRLPELNALYYNPLSTDTNEILSTSLIHDKPVLESGGGKTSSRHLRRRITAINSNRHRHRYPRGTKRVSGSLDDANLVDGSPHYIGTTRKSRRKKRRLLVEDRQKWVTKSVDDKTSKWLVTHLWHAKRFLTLHNGNDGGSDGVLSKNDSVLCGWKGIPMVHANRGPRAALRLSQEDVPGKYASILLRDISWEQQPINLKVEISTSNFDLVDLIPLITRVCPEFGLLSQNESQLRAFVSGELSVQGILHNIDSFPFGAIGPTTWQILLDQTTQNLAIEIRCHPSICQDVEETLERWKTTCTSASKIRVHRDDNNSLPGLKSPSICFRLYGTQSISILKQVLNSSQISCLKKRSVGFFGVGTSENALYHGFVQQIQNAVLSIDTSSSAQADLTLIYRAPRPLDCAANRAISGWEVYCDDAAFANQLWIALVTFDGKLKSQALLQQTKDGYYETSQTFYRGCCAIGLVEESHLKLECEPPIPVFPRDYVDTSTSQEYWMTESSTNSWKRIRQLFEGGWGRPPINQLSTLEKLPKIDFRELSVGDESKVISDIAVVRGSFGQPFIDAIGWCSGRRNPVEKDGTNKYREVDRKGRRRVRRSSRPKNAVIAAPLMSHEDRMTLGQKYHGLLSSLSLPAVLTVHIRAIGKGTIHSGMQILSAHETNSIRLGTITTGSFSRSRGFSHGIGIIGAIRLLEYLKRSTGFGGHKSSITKDVIQCGRISDLMNGCQSNQVLVRIKNDPSHTHVRRNSGCMACLSIIT